MTTDREARHGEDSEGEDAQEAEPSGIVYVDWQPTEGAKDHSQRVDGVQRVEVLPPEDPEGYDDGELVLHTEDGTCVFDRTGMRGFRTKGAVKVPEYERSGGEGSEGSPDGDGA